MENLTLQLPESVMAELLRASNQAGLSRAALAEKALRYYLFESKFADIHPSMVQQASRRGINTDEDVFGRVS